MLHIPALWYFDISVTYPQGFYGQICYNTPMFYIIAIHLWNIAIQLRVGCFGLQANMRCLSCSPLEEKELWNRTIGIRRKSYESVKCWTHYITRPWFFTQWWAWPWIFKVKFSNSREQFYKECPSYYYVYEFENCSFKKSQPHFLGVNELTTIILKSFNSLRPGEAHMRHWTGLWIHVMACHRFAPVVTMAPAAMILTGIIGFLGPVLLQRSDTVARIPANGSAAFNESCAPIG